MTGDRKKPGLENHVFILSLFFWFWHRQCQSSGLFKFFFHPKERPVPVLIQKITLQQKWEHAIHFDCKMLD